MLMMSKYSQRCPVGIFRKKEDRLYALFFFHCILNGLAYICATIHIVQNCRVQRTARRAWAHQLSEANSISWWDRRSNSSIRECPIPARSSRR
jgi:hypothetical protein